MKVLSKYVNREILTPMLVALSIFTFVFLMRTIASLAERLIEYQYTLQEIGSLLLFSIPAILGYVIPMSLLLGVIVGLNRMSADFEVIAITSSGVSTHQFIFPLLSFAAFAWVANTWLLTSAVPWANEEYRQIIIRHSTDIIQSEVKPRIFNENFRGFIIYVNEVDSADNNRWKNVFIIDNNDPDYPRAVLARRAMLLPPDENNTIDLTVEQFNRYTFPSGEIGDDPIPFVRGARNTFHLLEGSEISEQLAATKDNRSKSIPELMADVYREDNVVVFRSTVRNRLPVQQRLRIEIDVDGQQAAYIDAFIPPTGNDEPLLQAALRLPEEYEQSSSMRLRLLHEGRNVLEEEFSIDSFTPRGNIWAITQHVQPNEYVDLINPKLVRLTTSAYWVEIHKKFALPFTCFVFALLGLPLGLSSRRGGKAYGYIVGITIFVLYWGILSTGERLALYDRIDPALGIWSPNIIFGLAAVLLMLRRKTELHLPYLGQFLFRPPPPAENPQDAPGRKEPGSKRPAERVRSDVDEARIGRGLGFPLILDRHIMRTYIVMVLLVFITVYSVFSLVQFIDVNNDIHKNNVDPTILIDYFRFVAPETARWVIPISALMGTMICFGILSKNSEIIAFKSSGISIYRLSVPVIILSTAISLLSFYNDDIIIPATAPRLAEIKATIKARPIQTTRDPRNRWVLSSSKNQVYHFQFFDEDRQTFSDFHLFDIDQEQYVLSKRVYARRARWSGDGWIADEGWDIDYTAAALDPSAGPEVREFEDEPLDISEGPSYFSRDIKPSDQMSFTELAEYVENLETAGISAMRERFDMHWKLSFPFLPLVMTFLGLPFAFQPARRSGALTGIFVSISFVIVYWGMMSLFRAFGQTGLMPSLLAAWAPNIVFIGIGALLFTALRS